MTTARKFTLGLIVPVVLASLYTLWTTTVPNPFFPTPAEIADEFQQLWLFDKIGTDVLPSLSNFVLGFIAATVLGITTGVLLGRIRAIRLLFTPLLDFGRSVPAIMLIPPFVLILGINDASKIAIITLGAFFPIVLATVDGMLRVDPALIDVTRSLQLSRWKEIRVAWLPAASPSIAGGMQTGMQFALILMVSSEMLAATRGIGYLTMQAQLTFDSPRVWAGIVFVAILGFTLNAVFVVAKNRVLQWHNAMHTASNAR